MRNMLLIAVAFSVSTSVHGAEPWGAGRSGTNSTPWEPAAPAYEPYNPGQTGMPGASWVSPFDLFQAPGGTHQGSPGSMFRPRGGTSGPEPQRAIVPPASDINLSYLSGTWRGSAGERVEIRGNQARIWGGNQQSCYCIFMIHGNRMIAYSPDTDVVKKFEYSGGLDQFMLRDDKGGVMSFERVR